MFRAWYDWGGLNIWLFRLFNQPHGAAFNAVMDAVSYMAYYRYFPYYFAPACWLLLARYKAMEPVRRTVCNRAMLAMLLSYATSFLWVTQLKDGLAMPRPSVILSGVVVRSVESPYSSFPSGHATFAMLLVAGFWPVLNRAGHWVGCLLLLLLAISRMELGVHFPADIVGGMGISLAVVLFWRRLLQRGMDWHTAKSRED